MYVTKRCLFTRCLYYRIRERLLMALVKPYSAGAILESHQQTLEDYGYKIAALENKVPGTSGGTLANGWHMDALGFIEQWGTFYSSDRTLWDIVFPVPFSTSDPLSFVSITVCDNNAVPNQAHRFAPTNTNVGIRVSALVNNVNYRWRAYGR